MLPGIATILLEILPLVPGLIQNVSSAVDAWTLGTDKMKQLREENRDLTSDELETIRAACHAANAEIQAL